MTVEEFVREYGDDNSLELIDGEVCEREATGVAHFYTKSRISQLFNAAGVRKLGFGSFVGASFELTRRMGVTPDVSVIRQDRLQDLTANQILKGSPDIPFEVSISDKASVLDRKLTAYLANGAHAVCLVNPESRSGPRLYRARVAPTDRSRHPRIPEPPPRPRLPRRCDFRRSRSSITPQRIVVISARPHYRVYLVLYFCRERR
jgi:Uma2 family endonuclease